MSDCELSIVMPAYGEARALEIFLPQLCAEAAALTASFEILVVDTMQPVDDTQAVTGRAGARHIFRSGGNSYGDAVRSGIAAARGKYLLFMDGDGSHNPCDMRKLWAHRENFDIVIGSRYVAGGRTENPAVLIWMSRFINHLYRIVFGLRIQDVSNSFRLYRAELLRALSLQANDFDIVEEILLRLIYGAEATATEVPVTFELRKAGESKRDLVAFAFSYLNSIRKIRAYKMSEIRRRRAASATAKKG